MNETITPYLFAVTFAIAIAVGIYQWFKVRRAKAAHHHSARTPGEPRNAEPQADH